MTITQTAAETEHGSPPSAQHPSSPGMVVGVLSADHKAIGKGYIAGSLLFLLLGLVVHRLNGRVSVEAEPRFAETAMTPAEFRSRCAATPNPTQAFPMN